MTGRILSNINLVFFVCGAPFILSSQRGRKRLLNVSDFSGDAPISDVTAGANAIKWVCSGTLKKQKKIMEVAAGSSDCSDFKDAAHTKTAQTV